MSHRAGSVQGEQPWFDWMRQRHTTETSQPSNTFQPFEESLTDLDPEFLPDAPFMPIDDGDTIWTQQHPATSQYTIQPTANSDFLEDSRTSAGVCPFDEATLNSIFDIDGFLENFPLGQMEDDDSINSSAAKRVVNAPSSSKQPNSDKLTLDISPADQS